MKQFSRIHPIGWLFIGSLLLVMCRGTQQATDEVQVPQDGILPNEEIAAMLVEVDAFEDETAASVYVMTLDKIDTICTERPQTIALASIRAIENSRYLGRQYAVLNVLEAVTWEAEDSPTQPVPCTGFIDADANQ
ncbi:MAG: hypothetical protein AAF773_04350 [Cyanobacteria bacterium P01_D01_bin.115]